MYEYDLSLLTIFFRDSNCVSLISCFVFSICTTKYNKTFSVDYFARSLPAFTFAVKFPEKENTRTKSTREQCWQSAGSRVLYLVLFINSGVLFLTVGEKVSLRVLSKTPPYRIMTSQCANCVLKLPILITLAEIQSPLSSFAYFFFAA